MADGKVELGVDIHDANPDVLSVALTTLVNEYLRKHHGGRVSIKYAVDGDGVTHIDLKGSADG